MSSKIFIKRTSVAGRTPNTTNLGTGELALNMIDGIMFSSNGTNIFEVGANVSLLAANSISVNSQYSLPTIDGTNGQTIITDGNGALSFSDPGQLADDTVANNLVIEGNLTVTGNITYINSTELNIGTNFINLNTRVDANTNSPFDSGININRGALPNTALYFDETDDSWKFTNNGSDYISIFTGLEDVLSANAVAHSTIEANNITANDITANNVDLNVINISNNIIKTSNSATTSSLATAVIDSYSKSLYSSSQYLIEMNSSSGKQFTQINVVYDANNVHISEFGKVSTSSDLGNFSAEMSGTDVRLIVTPTLSTSIDIKVYRTSVTI
tara:strand:+ start:187 stop:1173 length:987 start_codon:yes stop_codon:yes gene_type:complete